MWSIVLMILIAAWAVYAVFRHLKKDISGECGGGCADCAARRKCQPPRREQP